MPVKPSKAPRSLLTWAWLLLQQRTVKCLEAMDRALMCGRCEDIGGVAGSADSSRLRPLGSLGTGVYALLAKHKEGSAGHDGMCHVSSQVVPAAAAAQEALLTATGRLSGEQRTNFQSWLLAVTAHAASLLADNVSCAALHRVSELH